MDRLNNSGLYIFTCANESSDVAQRRHAQYIERRRLELFDNVRNVAVYV